MTAINWDKDDLNRQRVQDMLRLPTEGDGVLIFDDTGFAKQGRCSVGVARQYSGTLGKVGNCQVTVNCHYAERTVAWPVATRLYLPKSWAHDAGGRGKARVPEEVTFQTKPQIALDLLRPGPGVGCALHLCDCGRRLRRQPQLPGWLGEASQALRGRCPRRLRRGPVAARRADATGRCPGGGGAARSWRFGYLAGGSRAEYAGGLSRCVAALTSSGHRRSGWLIGEDASDGKRRYYW